MSLPQHAHIVVSFRVQRQQQKILFGWGLPHLFWLFYAPQIGLIFQIGILI